MLGANVSSFTKLILIFRFIFGYHTTLFKFKAWDFLSRLYVISFAVFIVYEFCTITVNTASSLNVYYEVGLFFTLTDYAITIFFSLINGRVFSNFHERLHATEANLGMEHKRRTATVSLIFASLIGFNKFLTAWSFSIAHPFVISMLEDRSRLLCLIAWYTMKIGVSFNAISRCTLFEWNWRSIRRLREAFHRELVKSRSDSVCHVEVADIKKYLGAYNSLLENLNSTGSSFKISILWDAVLTFCYALLTTLRLIYITTPLLNIASLLEFVYHLAVFVYPSVMVELAKSEVQKIKYLVNEIRARHSDPRVSAKADDALQFLSLRPFEFVVWRFMSVNIQLPLNFVVLIVSYVIVTIQFTHIYG